MTPQDLLEANGIKLKSYKTRRQQYSFRIEKLDFQK